MDIAIQQITQRRINDNATHCMQNGVVTPMTACRQISISAGQFTTRRVYKTHVGGRPSERSTWQLLREGDFVIQSRRASRYAEIENVVLIFEQGKFTQIPSERAVAAILALDPELRAWLHDIAFTDERKAATSYLPAGHGWNGTDTIQRKSKYRAINRMLPEIIEGELREKILAAAMESTHRNLPNTWDSTLAMPKQMNAKLEHRGIDKVHEDAYVFWVLLHAKPEDAIDRARGELVEFCKQSLEWRSENYLGSKVNGVKGRSIEMPSTVKWAIKFIMNPYSGSRQVNYGIAWNLFKR